MIKSVRIPKCLHHANLKSGGFLKYLIGNKQDTSVYMESMDTIKEYEESYSVFYSQFPSKLNPKMESFFGMVVKNDDEGSPE